MPDFHVYVVSWLPALLLSCFFGLCESKDFSDRELTEPGVIVGIIVGVVGVLVVIGVSILLCRLFCCKEATCCPCCCKGEETYLEAGTVPIKIPTQESTPDNQPISTVSQNHPSNARQLHTARKAEDSSTPDPPQYDLPQFDLKLTDALKKKATDPERGSKDSLSSTRRSENSFQADDREIPDILAASGAKRSGKTPVRRKLQLGADSAELSPTSDFAPSEHSERSKKRNVDAPRPGREFPVMGHKHRKRHVRSSHEDDEIMSMERNPNEASDAREFPLLEYEPRKRSYPDYIPKTREETHGGDDAEFRPPVEFDREPQPLQPPYPAPRSRMERNPKEATDAREFPLLEYEPEKHSFNPSYASRTVEETRDGEDWEFRPVEFDHQPQSMQPYQPRSMEPSYQPQSMEPSYQPRSMQPSYPDYRSRMWEDEQRRPRDHREPLAPRAPMSLNNINVSGSAQFSLGRDNLAFNQESTQTTV